MPNCDSVAFAEAKGAERAGQTARQGGGEATDPPSQGGGAHKKIRLREMNMQIEQFAGFPKKFFLETLHNYYNLC